ncbi:MAG TPA: sigma factor [Gemmataceae bacterium]
MLSAVNEKVIMEESPRRGSSGAEKQGAFYREMSTEIVHLAMRAGLLPARAEDMAQFVWLKFCRKFPDFAEEDVRVYHRAWLVQVAQRQILDTIRANRRHPTCSLDALPGGPEDHHDAETASGLERERRCCLMRIWMAEQEVKDADNYALLYGRIVERRGIPDLAAKAGLNQNEVRCRLYRKRAELRAWLLERLTADENAT